MTKKSHIDMTGRYQLDIRMKRIDDWCEIHGISEIDSWVLKDLVSEAILASEELYRQAEANDRNAALAGQPVEGLLGRVQKIFADAKSLSDREVANAADIHR